MKKLIKFDDGNATLFGAIYRYTELQRIGSSYYLMSLNKIYNTIFGWLIMEECKKSKDRFYVCLSLRVSVYDCGGNNSNE